MKCLLSQAAISASISPGAAEAAAVSPLRSLARQQSRDCYAAFIRSYAALGRSYAIFCNAKCRRDDFVHALASWQSSIEQLGWHRILTICIPQDTIII